METSTLRRKFIIPEETFLIPLPPCSSREQRYNIMLPLVVHYAVFFPTIFDLHFHDRRRASLPRFQKHAI